ncbi:MAG TPA: LysR family transcriptional regulator, partial [Trichococcus flocculiformis]|nr:LysR family transcriptional regulator [Trichococcus flocculiformis]
MTSSQSIAEIWSMLRLSEPNFKFQLVSFENTPENAREILRNLGENIDIVAGVFDENFLQSRKCSTMQLSREPICVALSIYHPLAKKDSLEISDLYGENLMIIRKGWNTYVDKLRDDLWNH